MYDKAQQFEEKYYKTGKDKRWNIPYSLDYWLTFLQIDNINYSCLDVGCGPNGLWRYSEYVTGLDPIDFSEYGSRFVLGKSEKLPFPDKSFDTIMFVNSLDHVYDVDKSLSEARRVGKKLFVLSNVYPLYLITMVKHLDHHSHFFTEKQLIGKIENHFKIKSKKNVYYPDTHMKYTRDFIYLFKLFIADLLGVKMLIIEGY